MKKRKSGGGQGGSERRIEVIVKVEKSRGVRVDVNEELKSL